MKHSKPIPDTPMPATAFPTPQHNHAQCIQHAMRKAEVICEQQKLRFTPIRRQVLELIWAQHTPISAYDILDALRNRKTNAQAPTVYRALSFLLEHGLVHKIESLNAFAACQQAGRKHSSQFLICTQCQQIVELHAADISQAIAREAIDNNFTITSQTIELKGLCSECAP